LTTLEKLLVLFNVQIIGTGKVSSASQLECEFSIVKCCQNVGNDGLFVDVNTEDLALPVHTNDAICRFVLCGHEDSFAGDTVHVHTSTRLKVVEVDETKLRHQIYDTVFLGHLHSDREVIGGLGREIDVNGLFNERRIRSSVVNLNYVELEHDQ